MFLSCVCQLHSTDITFHSLGLKEHCSSSHDVKKGDWSSISQCHLAYSLWRCGIVLQLLHPQIPVMAVEIIMNNQDLNDKIYYDVKKKTQGQLEICCLNNKLAIFF